VTKEQVYELVNPSEALTFLAPSNKVAWLVALFIGRGSTPARRDGWQSSFYCFGGDPEADCKKEFGDSIKEAVDKHRAELVSALRSFMIHREASPNPLKGDALKKWNDHNRTSTNDYCGHANQLAEQFEKAGATSEKKKSRSR